MLIHSSLCVPNFMPDKFFSEFPRSTWEVEQDSSASSTVRSVTKQQNEQPNNLFRFPEEVPDLFFPYTSKPYLNPPCHILNRHQGLFPRQQGGRGVKLTTTHHLVPKLRMDGVMSHRLYSIVACRRTPLPLLYYNNVYFQVWAMIE
jgi:hypothetical protein